MYQTGISSNETCYKCTFMDDLNSTCVVITHPCGVNSLLDYPGLFNISAIKLEKDGNSAIGCVDVSQCEGGHHVAVFYFNGRKGIIEGQPLAIMKTKTSN